ncbi:MAG: MmgE/PrpD family protein [Deltaproteobacteria bacterium]|nr:MmgE/PrpD family protein [Deltaproteobacteria bacterium]
MALGMTASMASGIVCNFGTMTKPLHVGLAARNGVVAAKLAQSGYTANGQALEAGLGFYDVYYRAVAVEEGPIGELGGSYELVGKGIRIKPYPCGGLAHPAIDAVLEIRAQHGITAETVETIDVEVTKHTYNRIAFRIPQTGLQGKFSMGYLLARAVIDGKISLDAFTDSAVRDASVLRLAERVHMRLDPNLRSSGEGSRPCKVTVRLRTGQAYSRQVEHAKGSREVPMSAQYVERLETLEDIRPLCQLLGA